MRIRALFALAFFLLAGFSLLTSVGAQTQTAEPPQNTEALPAAPQGVEVLARGPVHEAFATPTADPVPTKPVPKRPPKALEEMPPDQKPEGDVVWINGYWAWDDDRSDYLWVSGIWRTVPPGKQWVAGYWKESSDQWQWVPGFWSAAQEEAKSDVTYLPAPPAPPEVAQPAQPPTPDTFYVPGVWVWGADHYVWRAGYWGRVQPGYVWVAAHYVWTPSGYVYVAGYWDLAVARRGVLFAPVVINASLVGPTFVYTPAYVVSDTILVDALFVRPCYCHYYFGDYYGPAYRGIGFESCIVFGRSHYDPLFTYTCWEHRSEPSWLTVQVDICLARHAGRAPCPPRTLVQQNTIVQNNITNITNVNNNVTNVTNNVVKNNTTVNNTTVNNINKVSNTTVLAPVAKMSAVKGVPTVQIDSAARAQAKQQAQAISQVATQRSQVESASAAIPSRPRVATLNVPPTRPSAIPTSFSKSSTPTTPHIAGPAPHPVTAPSATHSSPVQNGVSSNSQGHPNTSHNGPAQNGAPNHLQGPANAGPYRPNQARGGQQPPSRTQQKNGQHPPQKPGNPPQGQNHEKPERPPSNGNGNSP
jgi:hypothetical protein